MARVVYSRHTLCFLPRSLSHRDVIDSERRRERSVISRAKLNADRLPGEGGEAERPSLRICARSSPIQIAESGQRREQRAGRAPHLDKESVELRGRRSFRRRDIKPEGQVPRGAGRDGNLLIFRAGGVIGVNDDRVSDAAARECARAAQRSAGENPWAGPGFKPAISDQLCSSAPAASAAGDDAGRGGNPVSDQSPGLRPEAVSEIDARAGQVAIAHDGSAISRDPRTGAAPFRRRTPVNGRVVTVPDAGVGVSRAHQMPHLVREDLNCP